jgi:hypothetical protein
VESVLSHVPSPPLLLPGLFFPVFWSNTCFIFALRLERKFLCHFQVSGAVVTLSSFGVSMEAAAKLSHRIWSCCWQDLKTV